MKHIIKYLEENGWTEFPPSITKKYSKAFAKKFKTKHTCCCNEGDKQIECYVYDYKLHGYEIKTYEVELHGELPNENWIKLQQYAINLDKPIEIELNRITETLIKTWETAYETSKSQME